MLALNTPVLIGLIVSVVIPLLSSLLAKTHWPAEVAGLITLVLSGADGFLTEWVKDGAGFVWQTALGTSVASFALAVVARVGLWKGTTVDGFLLNVGSLVKTSPASNLGRIVAAVEAIAAGGTVVNQTVTVLAKHAADVPLEVDVPAEAAPADPEPAGAPAAAVG